MIVNIEHTGVARFFNTGESAEIDESQREHLRELLGTLHTAKHINDLDIPGWELKYKKDGTGMYHATAQINDYGMYFFMRDRSVSIIDYGQLEESDGIYINIHSSYMAGVD